MSKISYYISVFLLLASSCNLVHHDNSPEKLNPEPQPGKDTHTLSNADSVQIVHLDLDVKIDMAGKQLGGTARWTINNNRHQQQLILDSYGLLVDSVFAGDKKTNFHLDTLVPFLGNALHIPIDASTETVTVYYRTGTNAKALQWLNPEQTHDKKSPFLYTQSESIYARSWVPCPDGPGIRFTYNARISVPNELLALMSAQNPQVRNDSGIYHFTMENPIPAYLMALAVGDIAFEKIDDRTGIYAEPGMLQKSRYEFADAGKMVSAAESLYGKYRWGRYDVLVLPPGFPIGGMENPRLTFCTPTVIAGDRSLVSLISHELAHSWSGNLVTNATWNDIWLNEGFTNYFERRIDEQLYGKDFSDMQWQLGYESLLSAVNEHGQNSAETWLKYNLQGKDPQSGINDIPYEKGSLFLKLIETKAGRARFDSFLSKYFSEHAFTTMTTEHFLAYLDSALIKNDAALKNSLHIEDWVYGPGIPSNCPRVYPEKFKKVDDALNHFPVSKEVSKNWSTQEWLHYLGKIAYSPTPEKMKQLDAIYSFTNTANCEIAEIWFTSAIRAEYTPAFGAMEHFLSETGRQYLLTGIYSELHRSVHYHDLASTIYAKYRKNYHPLAQTSIDKLLKD
jgi:leukotriene-A4 hydrolase